MHHSHKDVAEPPVQTGGFFVARWLAPRQAAYASGMTIAALSLIVAHDENRLIGRAGDLPWRLPNDLKHFKALTLGHTVLMGRKTWESLPRRPLPGRVNRVLSRDADYRAEGAEVFNSLEAALSPPAHGLLFVIGGAALYEACLPFAHTLHLTLVQTEAEGDTWFPAYEAQQFERIACIAHAADETHAFAYQFLTLQRRERPPA